MVQDRKKQFRYVYLGAHINAVLLAGKAHAEMVCCDSKQTAH